MVLLFYDKQFPKKQMAKDNLANENIEILSTIHVLDVAGEVEFCDEIKNKIPLNSRENFSRLVSNINHLYDLKVLFT